MMRSCPRRSMAAWLLVAALLPVFPVPWTTKSCGVVVLVHAMYIQCKKGPTISHHMEKGSRLCLLWGPDESPYECCVLCNNDKSIASQYIPPGYKDSFTGSIYNDAACCCYDKGRLVKGGDGTIYFSK